MGRIKVRLKIKVWKKSIKYQSTEDWNARCENNKLAYFRQYRKQDSGLVWWSNYKNDYHGCTPPQNRKDHMDAMCQYYEFTAKQDETW